MAGLMAIVRAEPQNPVVIEVCDVAVAGEPLDAQPAVEVMRVGAGDEVEAFSPCDGEEWVIPMAMGWHPFLEASHLAFTGHRPLALSPDMVWLLLVQMAAEDVLADPEKHRRLFAAHDHGSRVLEVTRDEFVLGNDQNDWPAVFAELEGRVVSKVPGSPAAGFSHAFSTSTPAETAARQVVLLKAASPYFNYQLNTMCGIPHIELHGTAGDWQWIRKKAEDLRQFNMERRMSALLPILDECVAAAKGSADPAFWKSYYQFDAISGASYVSGWINVFFTAEDDDLLDAVLDPDFSWADARPRINRRGARNLPLALTTRSFETDGVVDVDFIWRYHDQTIPMRLRAGFMGVAQDRESMTLKPAIGWQVLRAKLSSEERMAADFLGDVRTLDWRTMRALERSFALDSESGMIRCGRWVAGDPVDSRFFERAFPLMTRMTTLDVVAVLAARRGKERRATIEAMLSAPAVEVVRVPVDLDPEYLRILEERTALFFARRNSRNGWDFRKILDKAPAIRLVGVR